MHNLLPGVRARRWPRAAATVERAGASAARSLLFLVSEAVRRRGRKPTLVGDKRDDEWSPRVSE
jgi:hypothetical protein